MEPNRNERTGRTGRNFWWGFALLLLGVVIGFLMAPVRGGVHLVNIEGQDPGGKTPKERIADAESLADERTV